MNEGQTFTLRFLADMSNAERGLNGLRGSLRATSGALKGIAALGATVGAVSYFTKAIQEAREAAKVTKQTQAVLKSTGGVAKVTESQIGDLATRLSNLAGVDDEVIQSGANLLLTFTKIRNETGKGNDVFNQATEAALNMSAAMGKDLQGSIVMVGKALNDPVKGINAMSKAGIQFTAQQKEQIKALVESGDTLGAQKIILGELRTQFGGMAAASADAGSKAKVAWDNMAESIGERVLPMFNQLATFTTEKIVPALGNMASKVTSAVAPAMQRVSSFITTKMVPAIRSVISWVQDSLWPAMQRVWNLIVPVIWPVVKVIGTELYERVLVPLFNFLRTQFGPALLAILGFFERNKWIIAGVATALGVLTTWWIAGRIALIAMTVATKAQAVAMGILNAVMNANPILRIVTLLGFLVGAFVYAWKNSETFRNVVKNVWGAIQTAGGVAWRFLQDKVFSPFMAAIRAVGTAFGKTKDAIGTAWNAIKRIVAAPINFVIKYVYNNGIRWLYNKVASVVGLGQLPEAKEIKLAGGGVLGGYAPGRDSIHAMLSPGEAVLVPELVQQIGPRNILAANKRASGRNPGSTGGYSGGGVVGYAGGGVIGKVIDWVGGAAKGAVSALTDPVGFIKSKFGGGSWVSAIAGLPARLLSKLGNWLWNKIQLAGPDASFATGNVINGLKQWIARENIGSKRYEWGAVGPNTYDCSGLVGTLWALSQNKPPFRRYFTTATMGPGKFNMSSGFKKGGFNVYLGPGHTAANIGGMHVEAYGGNGTQLAVGRVGTNLSFYNRRMHVNGLAGGGIMGLRNDPEARMASWWKRGWPEPYVFDNGGIWKSGTLGVNNTGHDEIVINPKKTGLAKVEKHYHLHANVSNTPVDLVTQYTRMEMLEPPL